MITEQAAAPEDRGRPAVPAMKGPVWSWALPGSGRRSSPDRYHPAMRWCRQQRFGRYTHAGKGLRRRESLRLQRGPRDQTLAPLSIAQDLDARAGSGRDDLQLPHAPAPAVTTEDATAIRAGPAADRHGRPHPFRERARSSIRFSGCRRGGTGRATCCWLHLQALFGQDESLERFWKNTLPPWWDEKDRWLQIRRPNSAG
jgi:hypothetical protein